jgi:hypothetical protein
MEIKMIRHAFVLNDIVTEGAWLIPKVLAGMFLNEGDEFVHVLRLDGDMRKDTVHGNLLI